MERDGSQAAHARTTRPVRSPPHDRGIAGRWGFLALICGWEGIVVARASADLFDDPASSTALLTTSGIVLVSLVAIGIGCRIVVAAARSPLRYVFRSRPAFLTAVMLIVGAAVVVASLILRDPFARFAAHGDFTAQTATELGGIVASLVCLGGGLTAMLNAWDARRDERAWVRRPSLR